ncbi:MAG: GAF domain-containing protein, partial [Prevotella sp.]|nr:GAF domain-containing protein [Prevotella sp.]
MCIRDSYRVVNNELLLGAFQGTVACYHIAHGRGVCGTAWAERRTLAVPDVEQFAGHIACSSESRSEIVVPIYNKVGDVVAVLDIDSEHLNTFDATDQEYLEQVCQLISNAIYQ